MMDVPPLLVVPLSLSNALPLVTVLLLNATQSLVVTWKPFLAEIWINVVFVMVMDPLVETLCRQLLLLVFLLVFWP
jgi:hypothetical protein